MDTCIYCKNKFESTVNGRGRPKKFCSPECRMKNGYAANNERRRNNKKQITHICVWCWEPFESASKHVKFCSPTCVGSHQRQEAIDNNYFNIPRHIFPHKEARRHYIRRKRLRENWVEYVDIEKLFERDKAICQLCFKPVPADVNYNHPLAPTIDHIIPVSKGGEHSYANCQLAHRKCNTHKNARTEVNSNGKAKQKREGTSSEVTN